MDNENLSLNENQMGDSTQGENDESQGTSDTGSEKGDQETEQGTENQEPSNSEDNPPNENQESTQEPSNQNRISEQIATLKKALEYLESQNEQGLNQEIEIAKLQEILQEIEQLRQEVFTNAQEKLEESEAYFSLVGVKVALLEKLKAQNEC
ncbi:MULTISPECIES: hypothetical protein [Helicobacter]|uniref:hypothetical protein n=1 Tax=Helicobacter TaxID=209 RepID=UPI00261EACAF|nr:hypothetical protein [Helicobacter sp. UBA3407]